MHLCVVLRYTYRGRLWKGQQIYFFVAKMMSICRVFLAWNSLYCSKIHFLFNETKVSVVNWIKWHYKLQRHFCGALYNQWICKKCAVPIANIVQKCPTWWGQLTGRNHSSLKQQGQKVIEIYKKTFHGFHPVNLFTRVTWSKEYLLKGKAPYYGPPH